jgi:hypothetical protein
VAHPVLNPAGLLFGSNLVWGCGCRKFCTASAWMVMGFLWRLRMSRLDCILSFLSVSCLNPTQASQRHHQCPREGPAVDFVVNPFVLFRMVIATYIIHKDADVYIVQPRTYTVGSTRTGGTTPRRTTLRPHQALAGSHWMSTGGVG